MNRKLAARAGLVVAGIAVVALVWLWPRDTAERQDARREPRIDGVVTVTAQPSLTFDQREYIVPAGRVKLQLTGAYGIPLTFADQQVSDCFLTVTEDRPIDSCTVSLAPGRYAVHDPIHSDDVPRLAATIVAVS